MSVDYFVLKKGHQVLMDLASGKSFLDLNTKELSQEPDKLLSTMWAKGASLTYERDPSLTRIHLIRDRILDFVDGAQWHELALFSEHWLCDYNSRDFIKYPQLEWLEEFTTPNGATDLFKYPVTHDCYCTKEQIERYREVMQQADYYKQPLRTFRANKVETTG